MILTRHLAYYTIGLCALFSGIVAKPSISFSLTESLPSFRTMSQDNVDERNASQMKSYR